MTARHILVLTVAFAIAVLAAFWATSIRDNGMPGGAFLVPGLDAHINDVTEIRIITAGNEPAVTLTRGERGWSVTERFSYPTDAGKLRKSLLNLAEARLMEERTSNPDLYSRLGVEDIETQGAQGISIEIDGLADPVAIILGTTDSDRDATNIRRVGDNVSWLANRNLQIDTDPVLWLDKKLLEVAGDRVQQVTIRRSDGPDVTIHKVAPGRGDFVVDMIPEGRALKFDAVGNAIGSAIAALTMDDVMPAADFEPNGDPVHSEYRTFDGLVIAIDAYSLGEDRYIRVGVAHDPASAEELAAAALPRAESGSEAGDETADANESPDPESAIEPVSAEEVRAMNQRFSGWVFKVSTFRYGQLTKSQEDLLSPAPVAE